MEATGRVIKRKCLTWETKQSIHRPGIIPELMQVITDTCNLIDVPTLQRSFENMKQRITLRLEAEGRHFEQMFEELQSYSLQELE
jgi:hypothetical protein